LDWPAAGFGVDIAAFVLDDNAFIMKLVGTIVWTMTAIP